MRHLILLLPVAIAACATTGSSGRGISIETSAAGQSLPGANCTVRTDSGSWNVVTPASVNPGGVNGNLRVVCNKDGYRTSEVIYKPTRSYGSSVGVGVGGGSGNVGVGVGIGVPISMGGGGYPSEVVLEMTPL